MSKLFSIINSNKINHCKEINEAIHPESIGKTILTNCDFSENFDKMIEEIERKNNKNKKGGLYNDDLFRSK